MMNADATVYLALIHVIAALIVLCAFSGSRKRAMKRLQGEQSSDPRRI